MNALLTPITINIIGANPIHAMCIRDGFLYFYRFIMEISCHAEDKRIELSGITLA